MMLYSPLKVNRHFGGGTCRPHLQERRMCQERIQEEAGSEVNIRLAEISDCVGTRREMKDSSQFPLARHRTD